LQGARHAASNLHPTQFLQRLGIRRTQGDLPTRFSFGALRMRETGSLHLEKVQVGAGRPTVFLDALAQLFHLALRGSARLPSDHARPLLDYRTFTPSACAYSSELMRCSALLGFQRRS